MFRPRLTHVFRQFAARPGLSLLLVGILALGIGVNSAMFGLTDQVLFRPVPVAEPDTLVRIFTHDPESSEYSNGSVPWFREMAVLEQGPFTAVAAYSDWATLPVAEPAGGVQLVSAGLASGAFFEALGVQAVQGRVFGRETDQGSGQHPVVVLSHRYWNSRFGGDPAAIGQTLVVARQPYTVLGVLPPGFEGPALGGRVEFWVPLSMASVAMAGQLPEGMVESRGFSWLDGVARLAPGTSLEAAGQAMDAWAARTAAALAPDQAGQGRGPYARLIPLRQAAVDPYGTEHLERNAWLLLGIAASVLLIAALNAAGLLAVRGEERARELAVRISLGAGPRALVAQLALDTLVLVAAGLLAGLALGAVLVQGMSVAAPGGMILPEDAVGSLLQPRALLLTAACALLALLVAMVAPARRAWRVDVVDGLRGGGTHGTAAPARQRGRAALVAVQLALTLMLLVGAGLLLRSLWNTQQLDPGFDADHVVAAAVSVARPGLDEDAQQRLFGQLGQRAAALPGVAAVGWIASAPVQSSGMRSTAETGVPGAPEGDAAHVDLNPVSPGALELLGIPLLRGRGFTAGDDGTHPVAVVNRSYAERFFPGVDPLGRRILSFSTDRGGVEVVGVVGDVRQRALREPPPPQVYLPMAQFGVPRMTLLVRTTAGSDGVLGALPRALAEVDPEVAVYRLRTLDAQLAQTMAQARVFTGLLVGFAALAALLAASGLYGTVSYWLRGRTRELGIRIALGASRRRIASLVGRQGAWLLAIAVPVGALLAFAAARALASLTFGVGAFDAAVWIAAAGVLLLTAALALWLPLRRALRLQPTEALRHD